MLVIHTESIPEGLPTMRFSPGILGYNDENR